MATKKHKNYYELRKNNRLCVSCGGELPDDRKGTNCEICAEKRKIIEKRRRESKDTEEKIQLLNIIREMVGYEQ
jgi:hypothetical protein